MNDPLVSIIMPTYNAGNYIGKAINSILSQTYVNWELLVVDDGSTDNTSEVIKPFLANEPRIKYYHQQNGKQGKARNKAIQNANGAYLAFLDADDLWVPSKLTTQVNLLTKAKDVDLIFSAGYFIENDVIKNYDVEEKAYWDKNCLSLLLNYNQVAILSVLVKREAVNAVGGFSESIEIQNMEDYHLWLKLFIAGYKFRSIPDRLFYYRKHAGQSTGILNSARQPMFYVYRDIFSICSASDIKKAIIYRLRWFLFTDAHYTETIGILATYFKLTGQHVKAFLIKNMSGVNNGLAKKITFYLSGY